LTGKKPELKSDSLREEKLGHKMLPKRGNKNLNMQAGQASIIERL
jgi:hypothetical protein